MIYAYLTLSNLLRINITFLLLNPFFCCFRVHWNWILLFKIFLICLNLVYSKQMIHHRNSRFGLRIPCLKFSELNFRQIIIDLNVFGFFFSSSLPRNPLVIMIGLFSFSFLFWTSLSFFWSFLETFELFIDLNAAISAFLFSETYDDLFSSITTDFFFSCSWLFVFWSTFSTTIVFYLFFFRRGSSSPKL